ncbi:MAG: hypothetical protein JXB30_12635 [Anaerolineae bacterium]|nr:hypothetical protein [Anaerolineae bacterium]
MAASPETLLVILGIFLVVWYLGASMFNRRRGVAIFRWLQAGLEHLGGEVNARWLGSSGSGAQIVVRKAKPPFRQVDIIYLLATRELLPLFLANLLRDKRDRLIVKLTLRSVLQGELEVVKARSPQARQLRAAENPPWQIAELPHGLLLGARGREGQKMQTALMPLLEKHAARIQSISWNKQPPHLIAVMAAHDLYEAGGTAASLYDELAAIARAATTDS